MPVGAAIVGGSLVAGGAAVYGANKAANASERATEQTTALQRDVWNQQRSDNAPYLAAGTNALGALGSRFGLSSGSPAGAGPSANPLSAAGAPVGAAAGFDGDAYLSQYPDVAAEYVKVNGPGLAQALGLSADPKANLTPQQFAAWHYQTAGQAEGRQLPAAAPAQAAPIAQDVANPTGIDPNANSLAGLVNGVIAARPAVDNRPVAERPTMAPLDVSEASYVKSPGYDFQLKEGNRNLLTNKSALGRLESGDASKALVAYGQDYGLKDYAQWRDYTTGQYNQDRNVGNANFQFDATRGDQNFNTDRAYTTDVYNIDRGYGTDLYNGRTNDLFKLAGMGQGAVTQSSANGNTLASGTGNALFSNATAQGNAALAGAGAVGNAVSGGLSAWGNYQGQQSQNNLLKLLNQNTMSGGAMSSQLSGLY